MKIPVLALFAFAPALLLSAESAPPAPAKIDPALIQSLDQKVAADYPTLEAFYRDLHLHPELSLMEERTSAKVAGALRDSGYDVTDHFGGFGIVAVLKNGAGPTLLIRSDMDGLPVAEETGLSYASTVKAKNLAGVIVPVMHACGHDVHMSVLVGTAHELQNFRDHWAGTVVLIGQPAEERVVGARVMLTSGLFRKFPKPDFAVALHDTPALATGTVGFTEGYTLANSDAVEITVRGIGGHGAFPQSTKDPIVLSAQIILALQTIVSRETRPLDPAVVTVGSIHGGTKGNVIPDEVKLQLTLRSYSDSVRAHTIEAIKRICRGEAIAAGIPDERMPIVTVFEDEAATATYNTPELTRRVAGALGAWLGQDNVKAVEPVMAAEDFSQYGRTVEKVPICMFWLGASDPAKLAESERIGIPLPSLHSSKFAPVAEPTIKTGVKAMTGVALELLAKR